MVTDNYLFLISHRTTVATFSVGMDIRTIQKAEMYALIQGLVSVIKDQCEADQQNNY